MTVPLLWYVSRATGVVTLLLFTATLCLGAWSAVSGRARNVAVGNAVHRNLALGSLVFLTAHITTAVVDSYVNLSAISVVLPFTSGYERLWVGLGSLAFDGLLAVVVTALLRNALGDDVFRWIHRLVWVAWGLAVAHGLGLSADSDLLLRAATIACLLAGLTAGTVRPVRRHPHAARRRLADRLEWS